MQEKKISIGRKIGFWIVYFLGTLFVKTWRMKNINQDSFNKCRQEGKSPVLVLWHDSLLPLAFGHYKNDIATIASDSKDGELITYILKKWGFRVSRGSSTRGGLKAAMNIIKNCRNDKRPAAITVDGPKGPRHEVKSGAVFIAKNLDKIIYVLTLKTDSFIRFNSWDKFILPKPFAKVEVHYSEIFYVSDEKDEASLKADTERLQNYMLMRTEEVCKEFV